ncbi:MAG: precorrin-2 C(20)-methyltransferase [Pseudomonadota bacterium]
MKPGTIYGVGLGPGDPDLMTLKAARIVQNTRHIAYFHRSDQPGHGRKIVEGMLREDVVEHGMAYPMTTELPADDPAYVSALAGFYECWATRLGDLSEAGENVAILSEGDPFFYGSFMHLYTRLRDRAPIEVVPGLPSMAAAWAASGQPMTWGEDTVAVLMGTLPEERLADAMAGADAIVVMKVGRHIEKIKRALRQAGKFDRAVYVEHASTGAEKVMPLVEAGDVSPYFSIVLVHGQGRRP